LVGAGNEAEKFYLREIVPEKKAGFDSTIIEKSDAIDSEIKHGFSFVSPGGL
jgi:hypothetical protein